jgi:predicted thioredoxin/glutaredoxin
MIEKHDIVDDGMKKAALEAETKSQIDGEESGQFNMRKQINSTTYEVAVYFSQASRETMDDKILRLAQREALNGDDGQ